MKHTKLRVFEATPDVLQFETSLRRIDDPKAPEVTYDEAGRYIVSAAVLGFQSQSEAVLFSQRLMEILNWVEQLREWSEVS
jgi:hypothetical protein